MQFQPPAKKQATGMGKPSGLSKSSGASGSAKPFKDGTKQAGAATATTTSTGKNPAKDFKLNPYIDYDASILADQDSLLTKLHRKGAPLPPKVATAVATTTAGSTIIKKNKAAKKNNLTGNMTPRSRKAAYSEMVPLPPPPPTGYQAPKSLKPRLETMTDGRVIKRRKRFTPEQEAYLRSQYAKVKIPTSQHLQEMANYLNDSLISRDTVKIWFQNKRQKAKKIALAGGINIHGDDEGASCDT
eukprot:comp19249_c0_seq2/m.36089 comp19249_c0_seq2/g.36089  ORF comp19249_c0_seq2/g.36089 comp19249_c0_seq2/m.36089 type:complete len:243 (+) comp19249_c0_seq2:232-960(+)